MILMIRLLQEIRQQALQLQATGKRIDEKKLRIDFNLN
jgi:hypothetical protein